MTELAVADPNGLEALLQLASGSDEDPHRYRRFIMASPYDGIRRTRLVFEWRAKNLR